VKRLPAGCAATAHFQQPRCAFVSDLCKMGLCSQPSTIYSIGASADGSHAFLALAGGGLLRTRLSPWGLDGQLDGHTDDVNSVEVRGDFVISGSDDRTVRVWRANGSGTDACVTTLDAHSARVWCAHRLRTRVLRQLGWSPLCGLSSADSALRTQLCGLSSVGSALRTQLCGLSSADSALRTQLCRFRLGA
jgi:WD40 repeat protein